MLTKKALFYIFFFFFYVFFIMILSSLCATYLIVFIINFFFESYRFDICAIGLFLLFALSLTVRALLYDINEKKEKYREYKSERTTFSIYVIVTNMIEIFSLLIVLYMGFQIGIIFSSNPNNMEKYFGFIFTAMAGAISGILLQESLRIYNISTYGKDYQQNIDYTKQNNSLKHWFVRYELFEKNIFYWKKQCIYSSVLFSLLLFVLLPAIDELINYVLMTN